MAAIVILAVIAAALLFFGCFLIALCHDAGERQLAVHLLRFHPETDPGSQKQVQGASPPARALARDFEPSLAADAERSRN